jgi:transcriptional regulator with XRE-family HTH domain
MSIAGWTIDAAAVGAPVPPLSPDLTSRPLHRIAEIRRQQGVSIRTAARRINATVGSAREQEQSDADLTLSQLYLWQQALDVPVSDLLVDLDAPLSAPVLKRAQMLKLMKTALAIKEAAEDESVRLLAQMMIDQLLQIMPELRDVNPWPTVGQRRTLGDLGRIALETVPDTVFFDGRS